MLNTTFDWNGKKEPLTFATENDGLNGLSMLLGKLVTGRASLFADVRTYWSPDAVERVCGMRPEGVAKDGFIHLINSGAAALDATGVCKDKDGNAVMKEWWNVTDEDIDAMLKATDWCPADLGYFRGGGYSSHFKTQAVMPMTMIRVNIIKGLGPVLQIAEGYTATLPDEIHNKLDMRTDPTWPTTWFAPRLTGKGAFKDVYSVMANWGANHGAISYGHIGKDSSRSRACSESPLRCTTSPTRTSTVRTHGLRSAQRTSRVQTTEPAPPTARCINNRITRRPEKSSGGEVHIAGHRSPRTARCAGFLFSLCDISVSNLQLFRRFFVYYFNGKTLCRMI